MKTIVSYLLLISFTLFSVTSFAQEPANLDALKSQLVRYHDSGAYRKEIEAAITTALQSLKSRVTRHNQDGKKLAIILDIDETSLSNYDDMKRMDFGGSVEQVRLAEDKGEDPAILPTLKLYKYAKTHNVAVFFLTGRFEEEREVTANNLEKVGYHLWDGLILRDGKYRKTTALVYKTAMRKQIAEKGYDIILNIGDQHSDLAGGYADKTFKLPNPYYFIL